MNRVIFLLLLAVLPSCALPNWNAPVGTFPKKTPPPKAHTPKTEKPAEPKRPMTEEERKMEEFISRNRARIGEGAGSGSEGRWQGLGVNVWGENTPDF